MGSRTLPVTVFALLLLSAGAVQGDDKLGNVTFPTSCDAKVQADFETGVAIAR